MTAYDPNAALLYGRFVQAAYTMYNADPTNLTRRRSRAIFRLDTGSRRG